MTKGEHTYGRTYIGTYVRSTGQTLYPLATSLYEGNKKQDHKNEKAIIEIKSCGRSNWYRSYV